MGFSILKGSCFIIRCLKKRRLLFETYIVRRRHVKTNLNRDSSLKGTASLQIENASYELTLSVTSCSSRAMCLSVA